eukprot:1122677-Pleurochrysis_carterae.AAC.2
MRANAHVWSGAELLASVSECAALQRRDREGQVARRYMGCALAVSSYDKSNVARQRGLQDESNET